MKSRSAGRVLARAFTAVMATATVAAGCVLGPSVGATAGATTSPKYMAAAEYFGEANPYTFWSSTLSGAPAAFAQMKSNGFNTVGLVVPWGEFEPGISPVTYDTRMFQRLDELIGDANQLGMGVILRLSYALDVDPSDQLPWGSRFTTLWGNENVYDAWLDYISEVHQAVARFHNVREAYISWEDLWEPVSEAQATTTLAQQLNLATTIGYRAWLQANFSLTQVGTSYGTQFTSWTQVPTPPADQPSFRLMYQYEDWALINRLFIPASQRFPGLTMETRVDVDPIYDGTQVVSSYSHTAQYKLPGTSLTGMYFSPYMGDPSSAHDETATEGLTALRKTLRRMNRLSGGHKLFIYEYEFTSNSPEVSTDPELTKAHITAFITRSEAVLARDTVGYALWVYRDYNLSPIYNQSFSLGTTGWTLSGGAHTVASETGTSYVQLERGAAISQKVFATAATPTAAGKFNVTAIAPRPTSVTVRWGQFSTVIHVTAGHHTYHVNVPASSTDTLSIAASGAVELTDVELSWFTQEGDVYTTSGQASPVVASLRALNDRLTGS
jgi:Cellulase (glycosyl hydrolase family 5)